MKNELEDIVPNLKLCLNIPSGAFKASAIVWNLTVADEETGEIVGLHPRDDCDGWMREKQIPAPTLKEILAELPTHDLLPSLNRGECSWICRCPVHSGSGKRAVACSDKKPEDAALKTWLLLQKELNREDAI